MRRQVQRSEGTKKCDERKGETLYIVSTSFLFLVVRPLLLVAMPFAPSSVYRKKEYRKERHDCV